MKILLLTQEPPLRRNEVVSGNAVRTRQLSEALAAAGHELANAWLCREDERDDPLHEFRNGDELQAIVARSKADVVLVGYWELLELLPYELRQRVIVDLVAPRPLEVLFEFPRTVQANVRRLRNALGRCDLVLVGNELQRHLLINNLLEAGFDLREHMPVAIVPLGAEPAATPPAEPGDGPWTLVGGGVDWPWRQGGAWEQALAEAAQSATIKMVVFAGRYRWHPAEPGSTQPETDRQTRADPQGNIERRGLVPYEEFSRFLSREAHIGVELAEWNIERAYSQSFRSLEFLRHGLPLLCNRYLPIAALIEKYQAGWLLDQPSELAGIVDRIRSDPEQWRRCSANALSLVREVLSPQTTAQGLIEWLLDPRPASRLTPALTPNWRHPTLQAPPPPERIQRQLWLIHRFFRVRLLGKLKRTMLSALFGIRSDAGDGRQEQATQAKQAVIFVTRGDLFPPDHGAAVRTLQTAQGLARLGVPVSLVTADRRRWFHIGPASVEPRHYPWWLGLLSLPKPLVSLLHYSKDLPESNSFLYEPLSERSYYWRILAVNRKTPARVLHAEFPAYAKPCLLAAEQLRCAVVLVEHNVEYQRLRAQVPELTENQYQNLRAIEIDLCRRSDAVVCVSDNDRRVLEADGVSPYTLHTIPHGVNLAEMDELPAVDVRERFEIPEHSPLLTFHGTFSYPPNQEAIRIFAQYLLPGLEERGHVCHVLAVGRDAPKRSPHPRIHFSGSVPQIGPWLKAADIAVVPLTQGGGTRMKILDCFAAGLPVISTSKGIEGIPVTPGQEAMVVDGWPEFIGAIAGLCEDRDGASELAARGRAYAESLDWNEIAARYLRLYDTITGEP